MASTVGSNLTSQERLAEHGPTITADSGRPVAGSFCGQARAPNAARSGPFVGLMSLSCGLNPVTGGLWISRDRPLFL
jgi:hypothetical protein